jgi:ribosome-binding factor A
MGEFDNLLEAAPIRKPPNLSHYHNYPIIKLKNSHIITMESIRQKQVGELIRRYFGMILTEEGSNIYGRDKLVTVTEVKMTPDLLIAKVYISVYGTENKQEVILMLEDTQPRLRQALSSKLGKQMRRMPDIEFFLDDTVDEMYRVEALLNRVGEEDKNLGK